MVELIVLSVVVLALLVAGVWYLLVRRSAAGEPARRALEPEAAPPLPEPSVDPSTSSGIVVESEPATVAEPDDEASAAGGIVEAFEAEATTVAEPDDEASAAPAGDGVGVLTTDASAAGGTVEALEAEPATVAEPDDEASAAPAGDGVGVLTTDASAAGGTDEAFEAGPSTVAERSIDPSTSSGVVVESEPTTVAERSIDPSTSSGVVVESEPTTVAEPVEAPEPQETPGVLSPEAVRLAGSATDKESAIAEVGALLVGTGAVEPGYVESMQARERSVSTFMGNLLAIPHGTNDAQSLIHRSAIAVVRYPDGIDWNGNTAQFVVGIAGADYEHVRILSGIAGIFLDPESVASLSAATSVAEVMAIFAPVNEAA